MCLPLGFETLRLIITRGGLKDITPNQVLGDVITQETYHVEIEGVDQDEKDEDNKKKSVTFKASTLSKSKGKAKKKNSSDDEDATDIDGEAMALFVCKFGKFMKEGYGARKRRDNNKSIDYVRRCYKYKSKDHIVADCSYNSENDEDEKRRRRRRRRRR
jgi:hypothetical protein